MGRRIRTIYAKELVEILRDRRTLVAMIVVPIALYPLLIIGSVHLLSIQDSRRRFERIKIAVPGPDNGRALTVMQSALTEARTIIEREEQHADAGEHKDKIESIENMELVAVDDVKRAVADGSCDVGVVAERGNGGTARLPQHLVTIVYDKAELRSESAKDRVDEVLKTISADRRRRYMLMTGTPQSVIEPIRVETINVATPKKVGGMVLGSIIPLVLVLMTITGAIYPAIDLTAGERERGTLESLIVCPVPSMELITGKYLVVTTIAMLGATLNLASVGATLYFGGFTEVIGARGETELPLGVLPIILLALIPFALLFSAVMVAVCSYARTFKEAQNYIMPVILAALIPGGIAALPGTELHGVNMVVPVMNMVLMARELLLGHYEWGAIALVMLSTSLYAAAAVIIASRVFSTEAVVFADSASLRSVLTRRLMKPAAYPSVSLALIVVAVLFPVWMFVQFALQPGEHETLLDTFTTTAWCMPLFLVVLPAAVLWYFKVNVDATFSLTIPKARAILAALLIGVGAWVPAHEMFVLQSVVLPVPQAILDSNAQLRESFAQQSIVLPLLVIAVVPAICEELFFRGFLFSGVRSGARKWTTICATACVFAVFHFQLVKFALTAGLGMLLGYLCWQCRSIWPAIVAHMLHNASAVLLAFWPPYQERLGIAGYKELDHLPAHLTAGGIVLVLSGVWLCRNAGGYARTPDRKSYPADRKDRPPHRSEKVPRPGEWPG